jgi:hypothetical protein
MRLTEKRQTVPASPAVVPRNPRLMSRLRLSPAYSLRLGGFRDAEAGYRARGPLSLVLILVQQTVCRCRRRDPRTASAVHRNGLSCFPAPRRGITVPRALSERSPRHPSRNSGPQLTPRPDSLKLRKVKFITCPMARRSAELPGDVRILLNIPWAPEGPRFHGGQTSCRTLIRPGLLRKTPATQSRPRARIRIDRCKLIAEELAKPIYGNGNVTGALQR